MAKRCPRPGGGPPSGAQLVATDLAGPVAGIDPPAGEHPGARAELEAAVALHHERLEAVVAVPDEDDGGGGDGVDVVALRQTGSQIRQGDSPLSERTVRMPSRPCTVGQSGRWNTVPLAVA